MATRRKQMFWGPDTPSSPAAKELWFDTTTLLLKRCTTGGTSPVFQIISDEIIHNALKIYGIEVADLAGITANQILKYNDTSSKFELADAAAVVKALATKTAAYTVTDADYYLLGDATAAAFAMTLPAAATAGAGKEYEFKKTDTTLNAVSITPAGVETIDQVAGAYTLDALNQYLKLVSDGTGWQIMANN